jgi:hypothetical protein
LEAKELTEDEKQEITLHLMFGNETWDWQGNEPDPVNKSIHSQEEFLWGDNFALNSNGMLAFQHHVNS